MSNNMNNMPKDDITRSVTGQCLLPSRAAGEFLLRGLSKARGWLIQTVMVLGLVGVVLAQIMLWVSFRECV